MQNGYSCVEWVASISLYLACQSSQIWLNISIWQPLPPLPLELAWNAACRFAGIAFWHKSRSFMAMLEKDIYWVILTSNPPKEMVHIIQHGTRARKYHSIYSSEDLESPLMVSQIETWIYIVIFVFICFANTCNAGLRISCGVRVCFNTWIQHGPCLHLSMYWRKGNLIASVILQGNWLQQSNC